MDKTMKSPLAIALAVIAAIGAGTWVFQLMNGLGITGMDNVVSWGLYLACFLFFGGLASGSLALAASIELFDLKEWKPIELPAVVCALVCICCAGLCVMLDVGGVSRVWRMIVGLNIESPLAWDMLVIVASIIVDIVFLRALCVGKSARTIACIALPLAILCVAVESWVFGMQVAKEAWGAMLAPVFVASSLDSGLALVLLVCLGLKSQAIEVGADLLSKLSRLLMVFVATAAIFGAARLNWGAAAPSGAGASVLAAIMDRGAGCGFCRLAMGWRRATTAISRANITARAKALIILFMDSFLLFQSTGPAGTDRPGPRAAHPPRAGWCSRPSPALPGGPAGPLGERTG